MGSHSQVREAIPHSGELRLPTLADFRLYDIVENEDLF